MTAAKRRLDYYQPLSDAKDPAGGISWKHVRHVAQGLAGVDQTAKRAQDAAAALWDHIAGPEQPSE